MLPIESNADMVSNSLLIQDCYTLEYSARDCCMYDYVGSSPKNPFMLKEYV